jgi:hypothetical protein
MKLMLDHPSGHQQPKMGTMCPDTKGPKSEKTGLASKGIIRGPILPYPHCLINSQFNSLWWCHNTAHIHVCVLALRIATFPSFATLFPLLLSFFFSMQSLPYDSQMTF